MSSEEMNAKITQNIHYLKQCTDYTSEEALDIAKRTREYIRKTLGQPDEQNDLAKLLATLHLSELFGDVWRSLSGFITQKYKYKREYRALARFMGLYTSITNIAAEVSVQLGKAGCLKLMIEAMDEYREYVEDGQNPLFWICTILINSIQNSISNISVYRKANTIHIFKRYLDCQNIHMRVDSLRILAYIVDEEESSLLRTKTGGGGLVFLTSLLERAISREDHLERGTGCSALELIRSLNKLAVNDDNKREIAKLGGIPVFTKMLTNEFSEDEQCAAVQALLNMSFIVELRTSNELQKSLKGVKKLAMSTNQHLQHMATYALWQIKGQHLNKQTSGQRAESVPAPPSYEEAMTQPIRSTKPKAQVMISYQWDNQKTIRKLRDLLVQAGYQVWMDVTHMRGSLLDAMAKAVETSSLVLVCMSERYKNSENCRAEAQYAHTLKKPIVPLLLEPGYKPDGWLGILGLTQLYYKVTSPEDLESKMAEILAGIQSALGGSDGINGPIQPTREVVTTQASSPSKTPVHQWSKDDVQEWLSDTDLSKHCEAFKGLKGRHLEKMYSKYTKDEDAFESELEEDYDMDRKTRMKFVVALEEACEN